MQSFNDKRWICLVLTILSILGGAAHSQNVSEVCYDSTSDIYNASSEKTINGFYSNRTYSFFTAVKEVLDFDSNQSMMYQNYWMRSNPMTTTSWEDVPFGGCLFILNQQATATLQPVSSLSNPEGVTTCEEVLPKGCNKAWLRQLNNSVIHIPENIRNDTHLSCQSLNLTMPYECSGAFYNDSAPIAAFGAPLDGIPSMESGTQCSREINIFNGTSDQNAYARDSQIAFASMLQSNLNTTIGNHTVYDYFVKRTNAVFMAAWPRGNSSGTQLQPLVNSVCLCPEEHILNNSRDPVNSASGSYYLSPWKPFACTILVLIFSSVL